MGEVTCIMYVLDSLVGPISIIQLIITLKFTFKQFNVLGAHIYANKQIFCNSITFLRKTPADISNTKSANILLHTRILYGIITFYIFFYVLRLPMYNRYKITLVKYKN